MQLRDILLFSPFGLCQFHLIRRRINPREQIEINETVVERGDQRIGGHRQMACKDIVAPRGVGDKIVAIRGHSRIV